MDQVKGLGFGAALSYHMQGRKIRRAGRGKIRAALTRWIIRVIGIEEDDWEVL